MVIIKAMVGIAINIVLNSNGEVVVITADEELLNFLEENWLRGRGGGQEALYFQQIASDGSHF